MIEHIGNIITGACSKLCLAARVRKVQNTQRLLSLCAEMQPPQGMKREDCLTVHGNAAWQLRAGSVRRTIPVMIIMGFRVEGDVSPAWSLAKAHG